MYDVIALFKPTITVKVSDVVVIAEAIASSESSVTEDKNSVIIENGDAQLTLEYRNGEEVIDESVEISELFDVPCAECNARLEDQRLRSGDGVDKRLYQSS